MSTALSKEKELLQAAQDKATQLALDLEQERASAAALQVEWQQKLDETRASAQMSSSEAVEEVTKRLTDKLEQQAQAYQELLTRRKSSWRRPSRRRKLSSRTCTRASQSQRR